jgi:hypothetical protein
VKIPEQSTKARLKQQLKGVVRSIGHRPDLLGELAVMLCRGCKMTDAERISAQQTSYPWDTPSDAPKRRR